MTRYIIASVSADLIGTGADNLFDVRPGSCPCRTPPRDVLLRQRRFLQIGFQRAPFIASFRARSGGPKVPDRISFQQRSAVLLGVGGGDRSCLQPTQSLGMNTLQSVHLH